MTAGTVVDEANRTCLPEEMRFEELSPPQALMRLIAPVRGRLILAGVLGVLGAALRVTSLVLSGLLVSALLQEPDAATAVRWLAGIVCSMIGSAVSAQAGMVVAHQAAFDHESMMRRAISERLGKMPLGRVQALGAGGMKKIVQGDVRAMHSAVADSPSQLGSALGGMVSALVALGMIEWRLLLVVLAIVPIVAVVAKIAMKDYGAERRAYDEALEAIDATSVEYVQGMQEVRAFDGGSESFGRYAERVTRFTDRYRAWSERSKAGALATRLLIAPLPVTVMVAVGGFAMSIAGWIDPVSVVVALLVASLPVDSFTPIMFLTESNNKAMAAALRICQVLDEPILPEAAHPQAPQHGGVRLDDVTFSYDAQRAPALRHVTIDIPDGTVCALVGPSGSGKSTIAKLVPRFFDVDSGAVSIGGVDVREIDPAELLRRVALVFQEPFLLHASIRENITIGARDATEEQVVRACRAARIHDEIVALPNGYDSVVRGRGSSLSGGQRQRVTIARALLSDSRVVILDEATAFADPENEAAIQDAIAELTKGRTVIIVAHRLSTIVGADQIVVIDGGRVVEKGTHDKLVSAGGRYARLWERHTRAQGWGMRSGSRTETTAHTQEVGA